MQRIRLLAPHQRLAVCLFAVLMGGGGMTEALRGQGTATVALLPAQTAFDYLGAARTSAAREFTIDSSGQITVQLTAMSENLAVSENLAISIEGPSSQLVDESTIDALGGTFATFEGSDGNEGGLSFLPGSRPGWHYIFTFPSLGVGTYQVMFDAGSGLTEDIVILIELNTDSSLRSALLATENSVVIGKPMVLVAAVFDGASPIAGASVSVNVVSEQGDVVALTLLDDGVEEDLSVGDGLYSGVFTATGTGLYRAAAEIEGLTALSENFSRNVGTQFDVLPVSGTLTGSVVDQGVDTDTDGLIERVDIDVGVDATQAGTYLLWVHLKNAGGELLVRQARADLQAGQDTMTVSYKADDLRKLGDGPYNFSLVELEYRTSEGFIHADRLVDAGQTQAYDLDTDFEPAALALAGPTSDMGVDDDTDGTFDRLVITIPVEVQTPGGHLWRLTLTTDDLQVIDSLYGNTWLVAGTTSFQVEFDGARIRGFGADGPYRLRDFHLLRLDARLNADEIGVTQSYTAAQFDAPNPLLLSVEPATASAGESVVITITGADTTFTSGVSSVDAGTDISAGMMLVQSKNRLSTRLTIDPAATLGPRTITVTTDSEVVSLVDAFSVDTAPELLSIMPDTGKPGASVEVTITGANTNFAPGISTVDAGQGIVVSDVTVADETSLTASLGVDAATAAMGPRTITVTTLEESVLLEDGFTVESGALLQGVFTGSEAETLAHLDLVVNSVSGGGQCWVRYDRVAGTFTLIGNDTDTTTVVGSVTAGSTNSVMNNRCTLYGNHSTASLVTGQLALEYHLAFAPSMVGENDMWVHAEDSQGVNHVGYKRVEIQDVQ